MEKFHSTVYNDIELKREQRLKSKKATWNRRSERRMRVVIKLTWSNDRWEVVSRARRACSGAFYRRSCIRRPPEDCWGRHGRSGNDIVSRPTVHHINPPCYIPRSSPRTPVTPSRCSAQTSTRVINKAIDARSPFAEIQLSRSGMAILSLCLFSCRRWHGRKYIESDRIESSSWPGNLCVINKHLETRVRPLGYIR